MDRLSLIGLEQGAWAVASACCTSSPPRRRAAASAGMAAFMQFESLLVAFWSAGVIMRHRRGRSYDVDDRAAKMNSAAVFISLLFWGWLWGIWGMLLGIPLVVIVKVVSEHVVQLQPVAELLGE
jgi:hypothetical protein